MLCYDNSEMLSKLTIAMTDNRPDNKPLVLTSPKQRQGSYYERQACLYLQAQGLILVAQNWQQPKVGELDLVMLETGATWSTLVFIEVRQRRLSVFGDAALSVTVSKQNKVIKTAKYFLQRYPKYADYDCRFDVIAYNTKKSTTKTVITTTTKKTANQQNHCEKVELPTQLEWLQNAFMAKAW